MDLASKGLAIIGVNRDVSPADAAAFLNLHGDPFAGHLSDAGDVIAKDFQVHAWPTSILVAGNGLVQAVYGPLLDPGSQADIALVSAPETLFADSCC